FEYYIGSPEEFVDGYFATGDLMYQDENGNYHFVSRINDMIKSGGENVHPAEVEQLIEHYPGVEDVVVFGIPDLKFGEIVAAAIIRKKMAVVDPLGLNEYQKQHIASYKKPRAIFFVEAFPRLSNNKINRKALSELYEQGSLVPDWTI
ncbi:MAG: fatty acid--CoA ligase family protein, partial [Eggerthellaceae bacterium]|nr:fatty acid--CoA ligase family protein [Eggerthellaceae bacterium]